METRKQYLDGKCSHREYYSQFVTAGVKSSVLSRVNKERLTNSTDKHLNDIPLSTWDGIGQLIRQEPSGLSKRLEAAGDYCTQAGLVCIAKEAARQIADAT